MRGVLVLCQRCCWWPCWSCTAIIWHGAFVLDDVPWILHNSNIRGLWPPWKALLNTSRPVVQWSLALNYAMGGLNVVGYHLINNLMHVLTALVLFGVVRRTLRTERNSQLKFEATRRGRNVDSRRHCCGRCIHSIPRA